MTSCICAGLSWGDLKLVWRRRRLPIRRGPFNVPPPPPDPSEDTDPVLDQEDTPIWYTHTHKRQRNTSRTFSASFAFVFLFSYFADTFGSAHACTRSRPWVYVWQRHVRSLDSRDFTGVTGSMTIFSLTNRRHFSRRELPRLGSCGSGATIRRRYVITFSAKLVPVLPLTLCHLEDQRARHHANSYFIRLDATFNVAHFIKIISKYRSYVG